MAAVSIPVVLNGQWHTIGNSPAVTLLSGAISQNRVSHAYLFTGPSRVGKRTLAINFARALNCLARDMTGDPESQPAVPCGECPPCSRITAGKYADVQTITSTTQTSKDADPKAAQRRVMIGIDLIKDLQSDSILEPYEGRVKVFIIDDAHRMSLDAANALLKTLEEPPSTVHIILTATSGELLPETIASRCHLIRLRSVPIEVIEHALVERFKVERDEARTLAKLSMGAPGWAIAALNNPSLLDARRQSATRIIDALNSDLPDRMDYALEMAREFRNDRNIVLEEVERWLELLRDIAMIQNEMTDRVMFEDRLSELRVLAQDMSLDDVAAAAAAAQKTRSALMVNALPQLAWDAMMLQMPTPSRS